MDILFGPVGEAVMSIVFVSATTNQFDWYLLVVHVISDKLERSVKKEGRNGVENGYFTA